MRRYPVAGRAVRSTLAAACGLALGAGAALAQQAADPAAAAPAPAPDNMARLQNMQRTDATFTTIP